MTPYLGAGQPAGHSQALIPAPRPQPAPADGHHDTAPAVQHIRTFAATFDQVGQARRFLAGLIPGGEEAGDPVTCLSELATNACLHSASARPPGPRSRWPPRST